MKKFTLLFMAAFIVIAAMAAGPEKRSLKPLDANAVVTSQANQLLPDTKGISRSTTTRQKAPRKSLGLVTPPTGATPETYYTASGEFRVYTSSGWVKARRETIQVIVDGTDIYIAGLAYWVENAWIKGTIAGTTATFPAAQQVDDDARYPEWISGSNDGETYCDLVFNFDQENGILKCVTQYIGECSAEDEFKVYAYWVQPTFTRDEPVAPEVVVLPDGLEILPYVMKYIEGESKDASTPIYVAVDGNDVYFQGMSIRCPEAWVKGTKDGNLVTFPAMQYMGEYGNIGSSYFFYNGETVFTYDPETATYTAEGQIYGVLADQYYDGDYTNPVLMPVVEKAAMPADPKVTGMEETSYGWVVEFNVPLTDVNGGPMVPSKLSYMIYTDTEGEIAPLTFTPATHSNLTEDMTEIPYGFTDSYDFYPTYIYLNGLYSKAWDKIGIQSIYRGEGVENATEIQWFEIEKSDEELVELPEGVVPETWALEGFWGDEEEGCDVFRTTKVAFDGNDVYVMGLPYYFNDAWLKGTIDIATGIVTFPSGQFVGEDDFGKEYMVGFDGGFCDIQYEYNSAAKTLTQVTQRILESKTKSGIDDEGEFAYWGYWEFSYFHAGDPIEVKKVEVPEGLEIETYAFIASFLEAYEDEWKPYNYQIMVGFDGKDVYFKGFSDNTAEMWVKGTLSDDGKAVTIPACQYLGYVSSFDTYDYYITAVDDNDNFVDLVLNYDAETSTFSTSQTIMLNGSMFVHRPYQFFSSVIIQKLADFATTPADPSIDSYLLEDAPYPYLCFNIPTEDVRGNILMVSKLFYTVWVDVFGTDVRPFVVLADEYKYIEEDWIEIPYTWDDSYDIYRGGTKFYINPTDEPAYITRFGVQSIYYGGGKRNTSNIVWMDNPAFDPDAIVSPFADKEEGAAIYNLSGQRLNKLQKGINIIGGRKVLIKW